MILAEATLNGLVDDLSLRVAGGVLRIYGEDVARVPPQTPLSTFTEPLIELALRLPAFQPAIAGKAIGLPVDATTIAKTGHATWARLFTAAGEVVADFTVAAIDAENAEQADVLVDRIDFQRGGLLTTLSMVLGLPAA